MPSVFIGPSYALEDRKADVQRSVNLMPTYVESGTGKTDVFLAPVPGLTIFSPLTVVLYVIVTSRPYAVLFDDDLDTSLTNTGAFIYQPPLDLADARLSIVSGTLRTLYQSYSVPQEPMDANLTIVSGTLLVKLLTYSVPQEPMDANLTIVSGTLLVKLITYSNWPQEPMDANLTIVSGTLA